MRPCDECKYLAWFDSLGDKEQEAVIISQILRAVPGLMGLIGISNTAPGPKINHNG